MSDILKTTILGCGSSGGVPRLGGPDGTGSWGACDPTETKNRRRRCSALFQRVSAGGTTSVLVDTSPDLREQMLGARVTGLDAVFISHEHADQLHGLDDLRLVFHQTRKRIPVYADAATGNCMMSRFSYCFIQAPGSDYPPIAEMNLIAEPFAPMEIAGAGGPLPVLAFAQRHGTIRSLGFRIGPVAYSSDVNALDEAAFAALEGVECWIVDALRYKPHVSHANVATALEWIARVKPKRAVLTNLHIDLDFETLRRELPPNVVPAYDGMVLEGEI
jgi:phosphoribosyl 1,2-cyclic phosphate phosphodiesterase